MPIEIRNPRPDEMQRVHEVVAYSFTADRSEKGREQMSHIEDLAATIVAVEAGEIVASLKVYPLTMLINGAPVRLGGVSSVSCLPEHRRKGHVGALLRHALEKTRADGVPLSALFTPHPSLYRKYGYMTAASNIKYTWAPKSVSVYNPSAARGRAVRVTEEDWPLIAGLYERFSEGRTGPLVRSERWWKEAFFRRIYDPERKPFDITVWYDEDGTPSGYMSYRSSRDGGLDGHSSLHVQEFIPLNGSAYQGLLRYLLSHDLDYDITWHGGVDDPLAYAVDDAEQLKRELIDDMMLRVVDVEKAVAARPPGPGATAGAFSVAISDAAAPWNQGTWRIECDGTGLSATKVTGAGDMSMEAATFAAVYDGFMKASEAVRSGLAEGSSADAARLADRFFASLYMPNSSDFF